MARNRGKKALYEVMSKARVKPGTGKTLEQLHPKRIDEEQPNKDEKPVVEKPQAATQWWKKPRVLQFNSGRIEFSLPYQIAVLIVLSVVLLALIVFRLGQLSMVGRQTAGPVERTTNNTRISPAGQTRTNEIQRTEPPTSRTPAPQDPVTAQSAGENVIVLKEYGAWADLEPVQQFFEKNGILTEIVLEKGRYFLQTKNRYVSTNTPGEDGYEMIKRIAEIGGKYKAPSGYENFHFKDAYGKNVVK